MTVPPSTPAGRYNVTVTADEAGRTRQAIRRDRRRERRAHRGGPVGRAPPSSRRCPGPGCRSTIAWPAATRRDQPDRRLRAPAGHQRRRLGRHPGTRRGGRARPSGTSPWATATRFRVRARDAGRELERVGDVRRGPAGRRRGPVECDALVGRLDARPEPVRVQRDGPPHLAATGASVKATFTGRTVGVVAPMGPRCGWVRVYIDGVFQRDGHPLRVDRRQSQDRLVPDLRRRQPEGGRTAGGPQHVALPGRPRRDPDTPRSSPRAGAGGPAPTSAGHASSRPATATRRQGATTGSHAPALPGAVSCAGRLPGRSRPYEDLPWRARCGRGRSSSGW